MTENCPHDDICKSKNHLIPGMTQVYAENRQTSKGLTNWGKLNVPTALLCGSVVLWEAWTHQSTEQVHSLQYKLLVADSGHSQILQFLVGDTQQLVPPHFLLLEGLNVLLQAVIQAWGEPHRSAAKLSVQLVKVRTCLLAAPDSKVLWNLYLHYVF